MGGPILQQSPIDAMFASILGEIEFARLPMLQDYKKVMLGTRAILDPRQVSLGAGPQDVDSLLDRIRAHETRLKRTARPRQEFFLRDVPEFDADQGGSGASLPSFTAEGIKYLFARRNARRVGPRKRRCPFLMRGRRPCSQPSTVRPLEYRWRTRNPMRGPLPCKSLVGLP